MSDQSGKLEPMTVAATQTSFKKVGLINRHTDFLLKRPSFINYTYSSRVHKKA